MNTQIKSKEEVLKEHYMQLPNACEEDWQEGSKDEMHSAILRAMDEYHQQFTPSLSKDVEEAKLVDWIQKQKYSKGGENTSEENAWGWVALLYSRLNELVELKRIKDSDGKTESYLQRQPMAWYAAQQSIELFDKDNNAPPGYQSTQQVCGMCERYREALEEIVNLCGTRHDADMDIHKTALHALNKQK